MYKQEVQYENFDGEMESETLYFNITKTELTENLDLRDDAEALQTRLEGPERELSPDDIRDLLNLIKRIIKLAYGIREGSKKFVKNEQVWDDFKDSLAYDAFLFGLFEHPERAVGFMSGVLPRDLREAASKQMNQLELPKFNSDEDVPVAPEKKLPTRAELEAMSREELLEVMPTMTSEDYAKIMGWK